MLCAQDLKVSSVDTRCIDSMLMFSNLVSGCLLPEWVQIATEHFAVGKSMYLGE